MILRGLCLDHLRKRRRRADVWQDWETGSPLEAPTRCGVEDLFFRETVTRVRIALGHLDETRKPACSGFPEHDAQHPAAR